MKHNDPFYFALPRGATSQQAGEAVEHIAETFGVRGTTEVVRRELAFTLCRVIDFPGGAA